MHVYIYVSLYNIHQSRHIFIYTLNIHTQRKCVFFHLASISLPVTQQQHKPGELMHLIRNVASAKRAL